MGLEGKTEMDLNHAKEYRITIVASFPQKLKKLTNQA
jgi:hypothetical protein